MGCLTAKASGTVANFISPTVTPIESARVYFSPAQLGEGTPSPENVREIVGRTSVELYQCGKNLFDEEVLNARFVDLTVGQPLQTESTGSWRISKNRIKVDGGSKLYCYTKYGKLVDNTNRPYIIQTDENDNFIIMNTGYLPPLTLNSNTRYIRLQVAGSIWNYSPYFLTTTPPKTIPFSWKRLPDEYQEVEYIENDETQYLITDYVPTESSRYELQYEQTVNPTGDNMFFGYTNGSTANYLELYNGIGRFYGASGLSRYQAIQISSAKLPSIVSIFMNSNELKIHDITNSPTAYYSQLSPISIGVFCWHKSTGAQYINKGARIYYLKAYNGDTVALNLIPCYRKSDNEIGMYDTVSQTFYTNQGTGTFTKGNDIFSDEVYGGYVDLVNGEIVETHKRILLNDMNKWKGFENYETIILYYDESIVDRKVFGNAYDGVICSFVPIDNTTNYYGRWSGTRGDIFWIRNNTSVGSELWITLEEIKQNASDGNISICYELATPITHPLPDYLKTQLQTLKNENTFWSDADSVEIDYGLAETFDIQKAKQKIIMNQPHVETLTGDVVSFTTDMKAPLKECKVYFEPVQEGSGDPSPSNVRNITGWSGVNVTRCGKNLFGGNALYQSYLANSNKKTFGEDENGKYIYVYNEASGKTLFSDFKPNTQYTFISKIKRPISSSVSGLRVEYIDGTWEDALTGNITDGLGYLKWKTNKNKSVKKFYFLQRTSGSYYYYENFGIFEGDVNIEDYEPYQGTTYSIDWTNDVGTVYGGYVDLIKGELVATHYSFILDGINYFVESYPQTYIGTDGTLLAAAYNYIGNNSFKDLPMGVTSSIPNSISNKYLVTGNNKIIGIQTSNAGTPYYRLVVDASELDDVSDSIAIINSLKIWLQNNPIQICYKLETPITYQLTPQQLITLKGQNNLWADTNGTTEIKFWKH